MLKRLWRWINYERKGGQGLTPPVNCVKPDPPPAPPGFVRRPLRVLWVEKQLTDQQLKDLEKAWLHGGFDTMDGEV